MLLPHPSARLEYWFFKVNSGPVALLVDWITRRQTNEQWLRVSIHTTGKHEVLFDKHASFITGNRSLLNAERTVGELGEVVERRSPSRIDSHIFAHAG